MEEAEATLTCTRCGKRSPVSEMKYSRARVLVCTSCYDKSVDEPVKKETKKAVKAADYQNFICAECRYKFKLRKDFPVRRCPFCGKSQIIEDKQTSAQDLIYESTDSKFE